MFIVTAKIPRRKLAVGTALAALLCCCAVAFTLGPAAIQTAGSSAPSPKGIRSNTDRVAYLQEYGWQTGEEPLAVQELLIPEEMDESYDEYLALQSQQGFDLTKYAGKRVKRYTYEILNHPSGETGVQANLLIYRNTVVGGEVLSSKADGFLHGLPMPEGQ